MPRFGLYVQLERTAVAPTPWTHPFARKPAVAAIVSLRSARLAIAVRRIAPPGVARSADAARSPRRVGGIGAVQKAASIIAIISARIARA